MKALQAQILNAVAYHPTMLFIPVELAGMNIVIHAALVGLGVVVFKISPVIWLFSVAGVHGVLAVLHSRDSHLVTLGRAIGSFPRRSRNLVPTTEGVKYVP